jgi:ion channel-forming bestrophin family protein
MIKYNPKNWFGLIFEFHKSDTLRKLIYVILVYGLYAAVIVYLELHYTNFKSTISIHSLLGFVLGLLLVFRTNTAYDRWWEGRKVLGALVNTSRNLALKLNTFIPSDKYELKKINSELISNYGFSMKNHLRDKVLLEEIKFNHSLSEEEYLENNHKPNLIAKKLNLETKKLYDEKYISGNIYITIDNQIKELTDVVGKCERIKKTPIPYSYNIFLKKFIFIYTFTLPLGLATTFFYWSIPISIFILYILASLELLAEEIENPFGEDANDLPVDNICKNIKENVAEILTKH